MSTKSWKDVLLGSGLPLEHDVKKYLETRGCIANFEYSYLKRDEQRIEKQFSYDVDAAYIHPPHFVNLVVECKYRHETVRWVFTPDQYGGPDEVYPNAFLHPLDHFVGLSFPFSDTFPRQLAPCCSKGVELTKDGSNDKAITQALLQLAYGLAPQVVDAIEQQIFRYLTEDFIFFHVPIIVTTATLFRLRDDVTLGAIRGACRIEDVGTELDCLVLKCKPGIDLRQYNLQAFHTLGADLGEKLASSLNTFTKDPEHLFSVLADRYPSTAVVISVANGFQAFDRFFRYVDAVLKPPEDLLSEIRAQYAKSREIAERLGSLRKSSAQGTDPR